jgi:hypothetical protein
MSHKWRSIDEHAALCLVQATPTPGTVMQMATSQLPLGLQQMPGVVSYYVSSYLTAVPSEPVMAGGEMVVVRTDQATAKAYNYVIGSNSNGQLCMAGPFKDFAAHHSPAAQPAAVTSMFGHVVFPPRGEASS